MAETKGTRILFLFAGYLRRLGSWSERIASTLYLLTPSPEESGWENSLDDGFLPATTYTKAEGRSTGCKEEKIERSSRKPAFASWWPTSEASLKLNKEPLKEHVLFCIIAYCGVLRSVRKKTLELEDKQSSAYLQKKYKRHRCRDWWVSRENCPLHLSKCS